jgi:hypothetical protein
MPTLKKLQDAIAEYETDYRRQDFGRFEPGALYDLFPPATGSPLAWPEPWPHSDDAGVYAVLDASRSVLYVGKASFNHCLGGRLASYFAYEKGRKGSCKIIHKWHAKPRYVYIVPVPHDRTFEASALEEFLIRKLQPPDNKVGCTHPPQPEDRC